MISVKTENWKLETVNCVLTSVRRTRRLDGHNHETAWDTTPRTFLQQHSRYGNINPLSIAYATRLGLGPTNPGMITIAQETLLFRRTGFSPVLKLLIPAFSLPHAPPDLAV